MTIFRNPSLYFASALAVLAGFTLLLNTATTVGAAPDGSKIFSQNFASCHANEGNIVDPKKPLKGSKILAKKQGLKDLLLTPKGAMTAFPQIANNDLDLSALYDYCKNLK